MAGRLEGKVALISGTAGHQGRSAALRFAHEGARVVGCDVRAEGAEETVEMVRAAGGEMVSLHPLDVAEGDQVKRWIDLAVRTFGDFDILYNNAGAVRFAKVGQMTWDDWHFTIRNELDALYWSCHHVFPHFKARGGGVIINTASTAALVGVAYLGCFAHGAAKGGVIALTKQLAVEGAPFGIRAVSISPGLIVNPNNEARLKNPEVRETLERKILLGRLGQPDEVVNVALFLASDEASYITGTNIIVDGGLTCW